MEFRSIWGTARNARYRRWGHFTLMEEWRDEDIRKNLLTGEEYVADSEGPMMWRLLCDCGHELTIRRDDFPGRRIARSCNRPECEFTKPPKGAPRMAKGRDLAKNGATFSIYLDKDVGEMIRAYGYKHKLSFSATCSKLMLEGLKHLVSDEP